MRDICSFYHFDVRILCSFPHVFLFSIFFNNKMYMWHEKNACIPNINATYIKLK